MNSPSFLTKLDAHTVRAVETVLRELAEQVNEEATSTAEMSLAHRLNAIREAHTLKILTDGGLLRKLLKQIDPELA